MRAILASDIHLQAKAPVARSGEPDWFAAMARPLDELRELAERTEAPILYAGDIMDRWNSPPEVINFAIQHLPPGYAIPGQHDLPNHAYDEIHRSSYWTLVKAGVLTNVRYGAPKEITPGLTIYAFPWGRDLTPLVDKGPGLHVAMVHQLVCIAGTLWPGAPESSKVSVVAKALRGFDVGVFGDNHGGFIHRAGHITICNCGGFMRRTIKDRDYRPGVGLLHENGEVTRYYLDITDDKLMAQTEAEEAIEQVLDMSAFVDGLRGLGGNDALNFEAAIERFITDNKVEPQVANIINIAMRGD